MRLAAYVLILTIATPAGARDVKAGRPAQFERLVACRALADASARLSCYDREVEGMDIAERTREIVVVDKAEMRSTRRSLFGFNLPSLKIFGDRDDTPDISRLETNVEASGRDSDGRLTFRVTDGARWRQIDDRYAGASIRPGTKVTLKRGAMGSYFADFENKPSIRVKRDN